MRTPARALCLSQGAVCIGQEPPHRRNHVPPRARHYRIRRGVDRQKGGRPATWQQDGAIRSGCVGGKYQGCGMPCERGLRGGQSSQQTATGDGCQCAAVCQCQNTNGETSGDKSNPDNRIPDAGMAGKYLRHMAAHLISMKGRGIQPVAGDKCTVQWYLLIKNVSLLSIFIILI
jgi:hypothetical protein